MTTKNIFRLIAAVAVCELAGALGVLATTPAIPGWYAGLVKPALNPPSWVFGPVWTTLYLLMGIALWMIWEKWDVDAQLRTNALMVFAAQLVLNACWSFIFFGAQLTGAAFLELFALWYLISATIVSFAKISRKAAWLLLPYFLWVSFALYLNGAIWLLNR
ncbi:MAG: tryptophan-rich sensory protein [Patescibacteria group bacterium]|nr:tryptophan-rich sensory protein [Patescibacteria group bacterium]